MDQPWKTMGQDDESELQIEHFDSTSDATAARSSTPNDVEAGTHQTSDHTRRWNSYGLRQTWSNKNAFALKRVTTNVQEPASVKTLRNAVTRQIFGLPQRYKSQWLDIDIYYRHLEKNRFEELLHPRFNAVWENLRQKCPMDRTVCWNWCLAVMNTLKIAGHEESIEKVCQRIVDGYGASPSEIDSCTKMQLLKAIFAVICWTSATIEPILHDELLPEPRVGGMASTPPDTFQYLAAKNSSGIFTCNDFRRPISKMFSSFRTDIDEVEEYGNHQSQCRSRKVEFYAEDTLYGSSLNYFLLSTIGRVRIKWVDTLTAHLAFDYSTCTLSIFCFPSFCAMNILSREEIKILKSIADKLLPARYYSESAQEPLALHREVLLSYRFLFGQSPKSRKLMIQLLDRVSNSPTNEALGSDAADRNSWKLKDVDPLLHLLCTTPSTALRHCLGADWRDDKTSSLPKSIFPSLFHDFSSRKLKESNKYSVRHDFPHLGPRLLALQQFNMRQQPSKIVDLWRDRRNPLQWYTFWAVVLIGGAGILLGAGQLIVGIVQVIYAARNASPAG